MNNMCAMERKRGIRLEQFVFVIMHFFLVEYGKVQKGSDGKSCLYNTVTKRLRNKTDDIYASNLVKKKKKKSSVTVNTNKIHSFQIKHISSRKYHLNSLTSLQKLLGKFSVPCHISHIYQDAAQPLRLGLYQIMCLQNGRKGTHYNRPTLSAPLQSNIPGCSSNQKQIMVNITQSSVAR